MAWTPIRTLKTLWSRLHARRLWPFIVFAVTSSLALAGWLAWPSLFHPYVRVANSVVFVSLTCIPESLQLKAITPYATLSRARLVLQDGQRKRILAQHELDSVADRDDHGIKFALTLSKEGRAQIADALERFHKGALIGATIEFVRVPAIDLEAIEIVYVDVPLSSECRSETLSERALMLRLGQSNTRLMHYHLIQDKLSDLILSLNETVGNILLGALVLTFLWLTTIFVNGILQVYFVADDTLRKVLSARAKILDSDGGHRHLYDAIGVEYSSICRRLVFARVVGPALGFLLTVSSLVAGLHPSATAAQDTFRFVSSLQLALIATFMGLLVRIIAEFALRFQRDSAERKLGFLTMEPK